MFISFKKFHIEKRAPMNYNLAEYFPNLFGHGTSPQTPSQTVHTLNSRYCCSRQRMLTYLVLPYYKQSMCRINLELRPQNLLQIPQKSLTSISQNLGKEDAQIKADDKERPCHCKVLNL